MLLYKIDASRVATIEMELERREPWMALPRPTVKINTCAYRLMTYEMYWNTYLPWKTSGPNGILASALSKPKTNDRARHL